MNEWEKRREGKGEETERTDDSYFINQNQFLFLVVLDFFRFSPATNSGVDSYEIEPRSEREK